MTPDQDINAGLDGVVVAATRISYVDGLAGKLVIAGFPLEAIAPNATLEEMVWLLSNGTLPNATQLADVRASCRLRARCHRSLSMSCAKPRRRE